MNTYVQTLLQLRMVFLAMTVFLFLILVLTSSPLVTYFVALVISTPSSFAILKGDEINSIKSYFRQINTRTLYFFSLWLTVLLIPVAIAGMLSLITDNTVILILAFSIIYGLGYAFMSADFHSIATGDPGKKRLKMDAMQIAAIMFLQGLIDIGCTNAEIQYESATLACLSIRSLALILALNLPAIIVRIRHNKA